jgi:hypothetical protein
MINNLAGETITCYPPSLPETCQVWSGERHIESCF